MLNRVLIADDDRAIRESLARALEREGYDVVTVADGVEALTRTRRDSFDALVVDVMMPHVDGLAICRVLRADGDRTPVLMLTARVATPDRVAGLDADADDYLPKPFSVPELLARLRALLRRAALAPGEEGSDRAGSDGRDPTERGRVTELSPDARDRLLDDVDGETRELGHLVDELVELALSRARDESHAGTSGGSPGGFPCGSPCGEEEPVELAEMARHAVQRMHRRTGRLILFDADGSGRLHRGRLPAHATHTTHTTHTTPHRQRRQSRRQLGNSGPRRPVTNERSPNPNERNCKGS